MAGAVKIAERLKIHFHQRIPVENQNRLSRKMRLGLFDSAAGPQDDRLDGST